MSPVRVPTVAEEDAKRQRRRRRTPWPNGSASRFRPRAAGRWSANTAESSPNPLPPARGRPSPAAARPVPDPGWPAGRSRPAPWRMKMTAGCGRRWWRGTIRRDGRDRPAARCATGYARSVTASPPPAGPAVTPEGRPPGPSATGKATCGTSSPRPTFTATLSLSGRAARRSGGCRGPTARRSACGIMSPCRTPPP